MADIVPFSFALTGNVIWRWGIANVAIADRKSVYIDSNDVVYLAEKGMTATEAACRGISINGAAAGQPVAYMTSGDIRLGGGAVIAGTVYIVGDAAGGIAPESDAIAGEFVTIIGVAVDSAQIHMGLLQSGVAHA